MSIAVTSTSFAVADVIAATTPLPEAPSRQAVESFLGGPVEACSREQGTLLEDVGLHPLIQALHSGFCEHRPVALSPDIIWLTICQSFAYHVITHAEALRSRLVRHEGRILLRVQRDAFVKGSSENDWPGVFAELSDGIRHHAGDGGSSQVTGWVVTLFPYLDTESARRARASGDGASLSLRPNWKLSKKRTGHAPGTSSFPSLPVKAPFCWSYLGESCEMEFVGGLLGVAQEPNTLALRPEVAWAVRSAGAPTRRPARAAFDFSDCPEATFSRS